MFTQEKPPAYVPISNYLLPFFPPSPINSFTFAFTINSSLVAPLSLSSLLSPKVVQHLKIGSSSLFVPLKGYSSHAQFIKEQLFNLLCGKPLTVDSKNYQLFESVFTELENSDFDDFFQGAPPKHPIEFYLSVNSLKNVSLDFVENDYFTSFWFPGLKVPIFLAPIFFPEYPLCKFADHSFPQQVLINTIQILSSVFANRVFHPTVPLNKIQAVFLHFKVNAALSDYLIWQFSPKPLYDFKPKMKQRPKTSHGSRLSVKPVFSNKPIKSYKRQIQPIKKPKSVTNLDIHREEKRKRCFVEVDEEKDRLLKQVSDYSREITKLRFQKEELKKRADALLANEASQKEFYAQISEKIKKLERAHHIVLDENQRLKMEIQSLEENNAIYKRNLQNNYRELYQPPPPPPVQPDVVQNPKNDKSSAEYEQLKAKYDDIISEKEEQEKLLIEEKEQLTFRLTQLEQYITQLKEENEALQEKLKPKRRRQQQSIISEPSVSAAKSMMIESPAITDPVIHRSKFQRTLSSSYRDLVFQLQTETEELGQIRNEDQEVIFSVLPDSSPLDELNYGGKSDLLFDT